MERFPFQKKTEDLKKENLHFLNSILTTVKFISKFLEDLKKSFQFF